MLQNASKIFFSYFYLARISKNYIFAFVFKKNIGRVACLHQPNNETINLINRTYEEVSFSSCDDAFNSGNIRTA